MKKEGGGTRIGWPDARHLHHMEKTKVLFTTLLEKISRHFLMESIDIHPLWWSYRLLHPYATLLLKEAALILHVDAIQDTPTASPDSALLVQSVSTRATPGTSRLLGQLLPDLLVAF